MFAPGVATVRIVRHEPTSSEQRVCMMYEFRLIWVCIGHARMFYYGEKHSFGLLGLGMWTEHDDALTNLWCCGVWCNTSKTLPQLSRTP